MWLLDSPLTTVFRRRENDGEPVNDRRLRARITRGDITRIAPGVYTDRREWERLTPMARHAQLVWESGARARSEQVYSHWAAAALHGIDILGRWPAAIDLSIADASGGRSSGGIRRHTRIDDVETWSWGRHRVATPLQTAVDLAAALRFVEAVAVVDQALWNRRTGGALVASGALVEAAHSRTGRGAGRAVRAADFASSLADSVRESESRVLISAMGFPAPELQARFVLSNGRDAFTDFFWREHRHIGEFDGAGKYRDPALRKGRAPEQVLLDEKDREDDLRRQVSAFSRWRVPALKAPRQLYDILHGAGLPTSMPRPGR
ncbi:hypothetical protein [Microbacterium allomyrinae]|uniref:Type IV toxin-antitoxin system AbiEi family antitoxin domain-containing protein n=1 Tax=Microbacterium allomyrinae TaxID=2830666 RepID=A0A9X1LVQ3_9MICO|nr:hypothetical protein [Microbacterium allomyrinae]MCC2032874.1 hypothetical protein [Microbacterium allomyrinae]